MFEIEIINSLDDNYIYLVHNNKKKLTAVIDPGESKPVINSLRKKNLSLDQIFNTHHHNDHVAGNEDLLKHYKCKLIAPIYDNHRINNVNTFVSEGDKIELAGEIAEVIFTPGHTLGHVCFYIKNLNILFSGDTLFRLGCGRVFEGTYEQMKVSLEKLLNLPDNTQVYCGHEYTVSNAEFCKTLTHNYELDLKNNLSEIQELRKKNKPTIPFKLGVDKKINPFLKFDDNEFKTINNLGNLNSTETFRYFRELKDNH